MKITIPLWFLHGLAGFILGAATIIVGMAAGIGEPEEVVVSSHGLDHSADDAKVLRQRDDLTTPPWIEWGQFIPDEPKVQLLAEGRVIRLSEDFLYRDRNGKVWIAAKSQTVNGASIPRLFWSITGGPLDGKYRNASILHDEACRLKQDPPEDVHRMFYEACRCGGVGEKQAKVLYFAVYHFCPVRWQIREEVETVVYIDKDGNEQQVVIPHRRSEVTNDARTPSDAVIGAIEKYVEEKNPTLADIEKLDPQEFE